MPGSHQVLFEPHGLFAGQRAEPLVLESDFELLTASNHAVLRIRAAGE
jgi:hypothetical protein